MCVTNKNNEVRPSCSWAMQKAAIIIFPGNSPKELGAKTYCDIIFTTWDIKGAYVGMCGCCKVVIIDVLGPLLWHAG